jgi:hypothetical protein
MGHKKFNTCSNCKRRYPVTTLGRAQPVNGSDGQPRHATPTCPHCWYESSHDPIPSENFQELLENHAGSKPPETISPSVAIERLPVIQLISDAKIRTGVAELTAEAPAYFWRVPAASPDSTHHHPSCREKFGLWRHTLFLIPPLCRLTESRILQDTEFSIYDRDVALAAAILHDQRKRGPHATYRDSATSNHDLEMAATVRGNDKLPDRTADAIASHMGPEKFGYDGPAPSTPLERLIHDVDMLASFKPIGIEIPEQAPQHIHSPDISTYPLSRLYFDE